MEIENIVFTFEELTELKKIYSDKYSQGAFIGMVTNLVVHSGKSKREILKEALQTRIFIQDVVMEKTK